MKRKRRKKPQNPAPQPKEKHPLRKHVNGTFYIRIKGRFHYLGRDESLASERRRALLAELAATGLSVPLAKQPKDITVAEALALYMEYARSYYTKDDDMSGQVGRIRAAVTCAMDLYGSELARDFGPLKLRAVQAEMVRRNYGRKNLNLMIGCLKRGFKWAASNELIPASVSLALTLVPGLRAGKTAAKESEPVRPVSEAHIEVVRALLPATVRAMLDVQLATGARPGEIVGLRPCDIDRSGPVWLATLGDHKTAHIGKARTLYIGPKAQSVLRPFLLNRGATDYLFNPREAIEQRHAACPTRRRPGQPETLRATERIVADHYDVGAYRRAVQRACSKAGIPSWHPHQLRHNAATAIRKQYGVEGAQVMLGHSSADITQVYAEVDAEKALAIAAKIG